MKKLSAKMAFLFLSITLVVAVLTTGWGIAHAQDPSEANAPMGPVAAHAPGEIILHDTGGYWLSRTSDCAAAWGWGDDWWTLMLSSARDVSVRVQDGFIPGDYFEVYIDGSLIGTTPIPPSGTYSDGTFTVNLDAGSHTIKIRAKTAGGCPARYYVWITLGPSAFDALESRVAALEAAVAALQATDVEMQAEITALKAKDTEMQAEIAALQAKDTEMQAEIAALQAKDTEMQAEIAALQAKDTEMQAEIAALQGADDYTSGLLDWLIKHVIPSGLINQAEKQGNPMPE